MSLLCRLVQPLSAVRAQAGRRRLRAGLLDVIGRVVSVLPVARRVRTQIAAYAQEWLSDNTRALAGAGPLWVVLGDSTAQAIGAQRREDGYVGQLQRRLDAASGPPPWRVLNLSTTGARIHDVVERQLPRLGDLTEQPALVTCAVGINDVRRGDPDQLLADVRRLLPLLPRGTYLADLPAGIRRRETDRINAVIHAEAPAHGLAVVSLWSRTGPPWRGFSSVDQFHPNVRGYTRWADAFAEALGLPVRAGAGNSVAETPGTAVS